MALPRFLVENFMNPIAFDDHTITASSEEAGHEAFRVGAGRRSRLNFWTPTSTNAEGWVGVRCDQPRQADMIAIDRKNNLAGHQIKVQASDDNFSTVQTLVDTTIPSNKSTFQALDSSFGALTEEGAWVHQFSATTANDWRLLIPAMGSGLKPEVGGLYIGKSFEPRYLIALPFGWGDRRLSFDEVQSNTAWVGAFNTAQRIERDFQLKLKSDDEYDRARYHIEEQFLKRRPMWIVFDQDRAERTWLGVPPQGRQGFEKPSGGQWGFQQITLQAVEHEPELI